MIPKRNVCHVTLAVLLVAKLFSTLATEGTALGIPVSSINSILSNHSPALSLVHLRGTVVDQRTGEYIVISDSTGTVFAETHQLILPKLKEVADVVGAPVWEGSRFRLKNALIQTTNSGVSGSGSSEGALARPAELPVLSKAWQVRDLSPEQAAWKYPVRLRGVVTYYSKGKRLCIQDDVSGIYIIMGSKTPELKPGDLVDVEGVSDGGSYAPVVVASKIDLVGTSPLPEARLVTVYQMTSSQEGSQWIEMQGVVHSLSFSNGEVQFTLNDPTGRLPVTVPAAAAPTNLLDAIVRVRGVSAASFNQRRQFLRPSILVPSMDYLQIEEPALAEPLNLPVRPVVSLTQFRPRLTLERRMCVEGTVTLCQPGEWFYLQDAADGVQVFSPHTEGIQPGTRVKVAGYPSLGSFGSILRDAVCRVESPGTLPAPEKLEPSSPLNPQLHGRRVVLDAYLLDHNQVGSMDVLKLQFGSRIIEANCFSSNEAIKRVRTGSLLRVSGIYAVLADESRTPISFQVLVASAKHVEIVQQPGLWTSRHTMTALAIMIVTTAFITLWVIKLRRKVRKQTANLQESELKFRSLVEKSLVGVYIIQDGQFVYGNPRLAEIFGRQPEEMSSLELEKVIAPEDLSLVKDQIRLRVDGEMKTVHYNFRGQRSDGSLVHLEVLGSRTDYHGKPAVLGTAMDITSRKRAEDELFSSRQMLRTVLDTIPQRVFWMNQDSVFLGCNKAFAEDCGYGDPSELVGKTDQDVHSPEPAAHYQAEDRAIMESGQAKLNYELPHTRSTGAACWLKLSKVPLFDKQGNVNGVLGTYEDITEHKRGAAELAHASSLLEALLDNSPDYIYFKDSQSRFVRTSHSLAQMFHVASSEELLGKTDFDFFLPEHAQAAFDDEQEIMRTGQSIIGKPEKEDHCDGRNTWALTTKLPWRDKNGTIIGTFGISKDVTAIKEAEQRLAQERVLFRALVENLPDSIYFKDRESRFVRLGHSKLERARQSLIKGFQAKHNSEPLPAHFVDPKLCADFLIGKTDFDLFEEDRARAAFEQEQQILRTGQPLIGHIEKYIQPEDGKTVWNHTTKMAWQDEQGNVIGTFGVTRDITALKEAEAILDYERELFRTLLDHFPDAIYFKDLESRFVRVSRSKAQGAFEACLAKFTGTHPAEPPPDHFANLETFSRYLIGKSDFDTYTEKRACRSYEDEQQIIATGKPLIGKMEETVLANGKSNWRISTKMPWRNKEGQIIGTFGVSKDITDLKAAEGQLETTHQRLVETSRLAGMAEVATDVLHNVGNVLNSVNVSCSLTMDRIKSSKMSSLSKVSALLEEHRGRLGEFFTSDPRGPQIPGYLTALAEHLRNDQSLLMKEQEQLLKHIEHIKQIVAMQQNYAKVAGVKETITANQLVEDALQINAAALTRHDVKVCREFQETLPISTEKHKVLQILVNLIRNAKYAMDEVNRPDKLLTLRIGMDESGYVRIDVIDNGIGIPKENLTRIFGHGFTTRQNGHGFGLHSSALTVRELGGSILARSDGTGTGATFTLLLPCTIATQAEPRRHEQVAS